MTSSSDYQLILSTFPDKESAEMAANSLVEKGLAACVNILSGIQSVYLWQGKRETSQEWLLLIKSKSHLYSQLESDIISQHPYELPEVISVPITRGSHAYLDWITQNTKATHE